VGTGGEGGIEGRKEKDGRDVCIIVLILRRMEIFFFF
jgi:hypothetical protein